MKPLPTAANSIMPGIAPVYPLTVNTSGFNVPPRTYWAVFVLNVDTDVNELFAVFLTEIEALRLAVQLRNSSVKEKEFGIVSDQ